MTLKLPGCVQNVIDKEMVQNRKNMQPNIQIAECIFNIILKHGDLFALPSQPEIYFNTYFNCILPNFRANTLAAIISHIGHTFEYHKPLQVYWFIHSVPVLAKWLRFGAQVKLPPSLGCMCLCVCAWVRPSLIARGYRLRGCVMHVQFGGVDYIGPVFVISVQDTSIILAWRSFFFNMWVCMKNTLFD